MPRAAATSSPSANPTLKDAGMAMVSGDVDDALAMALVSWILEENLRKIGKPKELTLILNSSGGSVHAGFAIIDAMHGSKIPVHTVGIGMIASMGLMIFIAGQKGHRTITPNTAILSHQWSWGSGGKEHELLAASREFRLTSERVLAHYRRCTGQDEKTIKRRLLPAHDAWLSAEEALKLGVCDTIANLS